MSYGDFARFYDLLTENIDYERLAEYYGGIFERYGGKRKNADLLDLACGSGNLSLPLNDMGYRVTGCDLSPEMLTAAAAKSSEIQWLCLDMTELPFEAGFDFAVCGLDSLNHLKNAAEIEAAFKGVYKALKPGGVFAADMNTVYKHIGVLGNNAFVFDYDGLYCGWQNELDGDDPLHRVDMFLDFFSENKDGTYDRYEDFLSEIALPASEIEKMLLDIGFRVCEISEYLTGKDLFQNENAEKFTFIAKKEGNDHGKIGKGAFR
ncbi:MAG: class I SAM-dependent methyltransferase [Bacteroides sp.]|nr:class I SAM-dependent methyltransferase [Bacteroides sp.]